RRVRRLTAPISAPSPAWLRPPGLKAIGERQCSPQMETSPMTKLSDTQLLILGAAAQRADLSVLPLPDSLKLKGGALAKVMDSLRNRGLIRVLDTDGGPERVVITSDGMAAIGVEQEDDEALVAATEPQAAPTPAEAGTAGEGPAKRGE